MTDFEIGPDQENMADKVYNVLFLCTGNSARSILDRIPSESARQEDNSMASAPAVVPTDEVNPLALVPAETTWIIRHERSAQQELGRVLRAQSQSVLRFVITVCDNAAGESCPVWPGADP